MKNKIKKIILIGLVFVMMLFAVANIGLFSSSTCDCADTYMGAEYTGSFCVYVDGKLFFRRCEYAY